MTLALGDDVTCTITNDDIVPSLTLVKTVTSDDGGTAGPGVWTLTATGTLVDATNLSGNTPVASGTDFMADTYTLDESGGPDGYSTTGYRCDGGTQIDAYTITLALSESATCTIINDDIAPTLKLVKTVTNNYNGSAVPDAWTLSADWSSGEGDATRDFSNTGGSGGFETVFANAGYDLTESVGPTGYAAESWVCDGGSLVGYTITLLEGQTGVTCTIENKDIAPEATTLTVIKHVIIDDGGTAVAGDWTMDITAINPSSNSFPGQEIPGVTVTLDPGLYGVDESGGPTGYAKSLSTDCSGTILAGQKLTCTITNDDIPASLTLIKTVDNRDGGTLGVGDFSLFVDDLQVTSGVAVEMDAGPHTVRETPVDGYAASAWGGNCTPDGTITMELATRYVCTITTTTSRRP